MRQIQAPADKFRSFITARLMLLAPVKRLTDVSKSVSVGLSEDDTCSIELSHASGYNLSTIESADLFVVLIQVQIVERDNHAKLQRIHCSLFTAEESA
jgi:hypothetical protein